MDSGESEIVNDDAVECYQSYENVNTIIVCQSSERKICTSIRYIDSNIEEENDPCLWVDNGLNGLLSFPRLAYNAGLVFR